MAKDITKVDIGHMDVYVDGTVMGHTTNGVEMTLEREVVDVVVDDYGSAPVEKYEKSVRVIIKTTIAEPTTANLDTAFPSATLAATVLKFGAAAGTNYSDSSVELWLHKADVSAATVTDDIVIAKAVPINSPTIMYSNDEQRVIEIEWEALIDESQADGEMLMKVGASTY